MWGFGYIRLVSTNHSCASARISLPLPLPVQFSGYPIVMTTYITSQNTSNQIETNWIASLIWELHYQCINTRHPMMLLLSFLSSLPNEKFNRLHLNNVNWLSHCTSFMWKLHWAFSSTLFILHIKANDFNINNAQSRSLVRNWLWQNDNNLYRKKPINLWTDISTDFRDFGFLIHITVRTYVSTHHFPNIRRRKLCVNGWKIAK